MLWTKRAPILWLRKHIQQQGEGSFIPASSLSHQSPSLLTAQSDWWTGSVYLDFLFLCQSGNWDLKNEKSRCWLRTQIEGPAFQRYTEKVWGKNSSFSGNSASAHLNWQNLEDVNATPLLLQRHFSLFIIFKCNMTDLHKIGSLWGIFRFPCFF